MIQTHEVRRGNLVNLKCEGTKPKAFLKPLIIEEIRVRRFTVIDNLGFFIDFSAGELEGVPLTAEILEALGFKWNSPEWQPADGSGFLLTKDFYYTNGEGLNIGNELKFLHQLQNLFFAIIGEEINIPYKTF